MQSLTTAQNQIASDKHRFRVINCGRRFGKTTLAIEEIKGMALAKEARIAYIAPTIQQARDIAWEMMLKELKSIIVKAVESPSREIVVKNLKGTTSLIQLRGWEAIETLRGQAFDFIVIDEVATMRGFQIKWQEIIRPTLTDRKGQVMFISTPKGFNHFYELYNMDGKDLDYRSFHFSSYDNPYLPKEEIDKAKEELTEDRFAQEYLADFRKTEGLVYKEFDRTKHLYTNETEEGRIVETLGGVDFGHTNPAAVLTVARDYDNNYWVRNEWYKTGQTESQIAEVVSAKKFNKVYPDSESPSAIKELITRGVNVREVFKNKDSIANGINKIRELLKANRIKINKSCENLIYEFETYSYPEKKDMHNYDENPIKENDHALDSLRYVILMQGEAQHAQAKQFYPHLKR